MRDRWGVGWFSGAVAGRGGGVVGAIVVALRCVASRRGDGGWQDEQRSASSDGRVVWRRQTTRCSTLTPLSHTTHPLKIIGML